MRIILTKKLNSKSYNITNLLVGYTWEGSIEKGTRTFSFDVINAPLDSNLMSYIPVFAIGDTISFYTDSDYAVPDYLLFFGQIESTGKKNNKGTITYTCHDLLIHLTRSSTYRTYNAPAEAIAASICGEFGMTVQYLAPTGVNIGITVFEDKTYFDIISECYKKASLSTGQKYFMGMDGDKFYTQVEGYPLLTIKISDGTDKENGGKGNILSGTFNESMSDIINRVNVYDSDGKFQTRVEDAESINRYGLFETNYTIEKDVDMVTGAKSQLHGVDTDIDFEVMGEVNYWSGRSVMVHDSATGLEGQYLIINDTHNWSGGKYTTKLKLRYMGLVG